MVLKEPAQGLDEGASLRCGNTSPLGERRMRASNHGVDIARARRRHAEEFLTGDGGARDQSIASRNLRSAGCEGSPGDGLEVSVGSHAPSLPGPWTEGAKSPTVVLDDADRDGTALGNLRTGHRIL